MKMENKRDLVDVLQEAKVFYLATADAEPEGKPHVRPFGAVVRYDGKTWFCTGKWKNVYAQIMANANIEISATIEGERGPEIVRASGYAVFEDNQGAKDAMFESMPELKKMYADKLDQFMVFYLIGQPARVYSMDGTVREEVEVIKS